jgi:hypothetical protein
MRKEKTQEQMPPVWERGQRNFVCVSFSQAMGPETARLVYSMGTLDA